MKWTTFLIQQSFNKEIAYKSTEPFQERLQTTSLFTNLWSGLYSPVGQGGHADSPISQLSSLLVPGGQVAQPLAIAELPYTDCQQDINYE